MTHFDAKEANQTAGPCPNCRAPADVDLIDASYYGETHFIAGEARCSARCYEQDPDAYLAALPKETRRSP